MRRELHAAKAIAIAVRDAPRAVASAAPSSASSSDEANDEGQEEEQTFEQWRDNLSSQFYTEAHDRDWSVPSEELLKKNLAATLPGSSEVVSLECRQSVCRAEISHTDLESHRDFVEGFTRSLKWPGPGMVTLDESAGPGAVTSLAFFSRQEDQPAIERDTEF